MLQDYQFEAFCYNLDSVHISSPCGAMGSVLVVCTDNLGV